MASRVRNLHQTTPAPQNKAAAAGPAAAPAAGELKVYSAFDFIPGDQVIAREDFSQDAKGDFPAKWNTQCRWGDRNPGRTSGTMAGYIQNRGIYAGIHPYSAG